MSNTVPDDDQPCDTHGKEDTRPNFRMPDLMFPEPRAALDQYLPAEQPEARRLWSTPGNPSEDSRQPPPA